MNTNQLRDQAARCFRTALACPDPEFAGHLVRIGWELREKAERLERSREQRPVIGSTVWVDFRMAASA